MVWSFRVAIGSGDKSILLPSFLHRTAGPKLAESGSAQGHVRRLALLVQARGGGVPPRCCLAIVGGSPSSRRPHPAWEKCIRRSEYLAQVYGQLAGGTPSPAGDAASRRRVPRGSGIDQRSRRAEYHRAHQDVRAEER